MYQKCHCKRAIHTRVVYARELEKKNERLLTVYYIQTYWVCTAFEERNVRWAQQIMEYKRFDFIPYGFVIENYMTVDNLTAQSIFRFW